jgi:biotin carboxylase
MDDGIERFLCLASHEKGHEFLRQCARLGVRPTLLTLDSLGSAAWPREALEEMSTMPAGLSREQILNTVSWMARGRRFARVIALDESSQELAAQVREHLRVPGMGITTAAYYRDRLAMRMSARESGFPVPEFCRVLNYDELREFMERVPPPWLLPQRISETLWGTRRIESPEQLWRTLDELGDGQSNFMLEQYVAGEIYCVDAIVNQHEVLFSWAHRCDRLPRHEDQEGVYIARTLDHGSREWLELTALNAGLAPSLGMVRGITHAEYIRSREDGRFYFLEIAARAEAAPTAGLVELASGMNLAREWAQLEVAHLRGASYVPPESYESYAGCLLCQSHTVEPETGFCNAPEIVSRTKQPRQTAVTLRGDDPQRLQTLLEQYSSEMTRRFLAPLVAVGQ